MRSLRVRRCGPRLGSALLAATGLGCSRSFLEVRVLPLTCTSTDRGSASLQCDEPTLFGWATSNATISYPPALAAAGVTGRVDASIWVGTDGSVDSVRINSASSPLLTASTERTLRTWRFRHMDRSVLPGRRVLVAEILFRLGGCPDVTRLPQRVVALHTGILVEVLTCGIRQTRSLPISRMPSA